MAHAALSLSPGSSPATSSEAAEVDRAAWSLTADRASAICGLFAMGWLVGSAWPGLGLPAWPAASMGLIALSLGLGSGRVLPRALGTILGFLGLVGGCLQIVALWSVAWVLG